MPLVVSVTVTSVNRTVIGGLHDGWNVAVAESVKSALPLWIGKSPAAENEVLFAAFGCLPPPLTHSAVAVRTMWTCASSPSPASFPETVIVLPARDALNAL